MSTDWKTSYEKWNRFAELDAALKAELSGVSGDEKIWKTAFIKTLSSERAVCAGNWAPARTA